MLPGQAGGPLPSRVPAPLPLRSCPAEAPGRGARSRFVTQLIVTMADAGVRSRRGVREGGAAAEGGADEIRCRCLPAWLRRVHAIRDAAPQPACRCALTGVPGVMSVPEQSESGGRAETDSPQVSVSGGWVWGWGRGAVGSAGRRAVPGGEQRRAAN